MESPPPDIPPETGKLSEFATALARGRLQIQKSQALLRRVRAGNTDLSFKTFEGMLSTVGIREALTYLLRLTDYRFIAIFRFLDGKARAVVHVDRTDLSVVSIDEVPETATYCNFVRVEKKPFVVADAMLDPLAADHEAREVIRAYCGVPILDPEGELIGVLCHYDLEPRDPEQLNLELLLRVSSALAYSGLVPAYPVASKA